MEIILLGEANNWVEVAHEGGGPISSKWGNMFDKAKEIQNPNPYVKGESLKA